MQSSNKLKIGDNAPDFSLPNEDNVSISLDDLSTHTIVLYFYPKDNTSGCTTQAKEFSDLIDEFRALNTIIIGISPDSTNTHKKFIQSHELKIILLSDKDKQVATKYHAYGEKMMYGKKVFGIIRSVFVIKDKTIMQTFYNIKAKGSALKTLDFIKENLK